MQGRPEAVARAAEVVADGGRVQTRVDAREQDDEVLSGKIWNELVVCREELGLGGLPGSG